MLTEKETIETIKKIGKLCEEVEKKASLIEKATGKYPEEMVSQFYGRLRQIAEEVKKQSPFKLPPLPWEKQLSGS